MKKFKTAVWLIMISLLALAGSLAVRAATFEDSPDAIAIRVMPNPEHLPADVWYARNISGQGSPQSIIVDGYEGVRDGRSVYVNAGNIAGDPGSESLFTNIYIISHTQEAFPETEEIFSQLVRYWKFNVDLVRQTGSGACRPLSKTKCDENDDCDDSREGLNCVEGFCASKCLLDSDCSGSQYCSSEKAKVVRDVKRLTDISLMNEYLERYYDNNGNFPTLPDGSYLPGKSTSVWPSWSETLSNVLGRQLPKDPRNKMGACPGFDPVTCWNEFDKKFATDFDDPVLPEDSHVYFYEPRDRGFAYKLCTNFETSSKFDNLPEIHDCDKSDFVTSDLPIDIITGSCVRNRGGFDPCYFQVNSRVDIDWPRTEIKPVEPAGWGGWSADGWQWSGSNSGLGWSNTVVPNQKALTADAINLPQSKLFGIYKYEVTVYDVFGKSQSREGEIRICNPRTCAGLECGRIDDLCGRTLLCGSCGQGEHCLKHQCVPD